MTENEPRSRWVVAAASLTLVLATGGALILSPGPTAPSGTRQGYVPTFEGDVLQGFRPDLFALPDDELAGFRPIPGGSFLMGSDPAVDSMAFAIERWSAQERQGRIDLPSYYMGRYEVTVAQFVSFVRETGHAVPDPEALGTLPTAPVVNVSWVDALVYARWLDTSLRASSVTPPALQALLQDGWHVGLPNEAEWEKAARGTEGALFPWGNAADPEFANYGGTQVEPVGSRDCPCAHRLSDMAGNVWEWTASPYQPYPHTSGDDARTAGEDALWVMRGGSFQDGPQLVRSANRGGADPGARRPFIGFRVALLPSR